jgi:hypothetical protein
MVNQAKTMVSKLYNLPLIFLQNWFVGSKVGADLSE